MSLWFNEPLPPEILGRPVLVLLDREHSRLMDEADRLNLAILQRLHDAYQDELIENDKLPLLLEELNLLRSIDDPATASFVEDLATLTVWLIEQGGDLEANAD